MNKNDIQFRKKCDLRYSMVKKFAKKMDEAAISKEMDDILKVANDWKKHEKSVRMRINMLNSLLARVGMEKRKLSLLKVGGSKDND